MTDIYGNDNQLNFDISLDAESKRDSQKGSLAIQGNTATSQQKTTIVTENKKTTQKSPLKESESCKRPGGGLSCCSLEYWQMYFSIETPDLIKRLHYSLNPRKTSAFIEEISTKPDLYGPLWISSALIFMSIICSTAYSVAMRIFSGDSEKTYIIDYKVLGFIFSTVYGFLFGFGFIATLWLKFLNVDTSLVRVGLASLESRHVRVLFHSLSDLSGSPMDRHSLAADYLHSRLWPLLSHQTFSDLLHVIIVHAEICSAAQSYRKSSRY